MLLRNRGPMIVRADTHHGTQRPHRNQFSQLRFQSLHPSGRLLHCFDVLVQTNLLARLRESLLGQPLHVALGPVRPARVAPAMTQQKRT
jgi:hypothetical protein